MKYFLSFAITLITAFYTKAQNTPALIDGRGSDVTALKIERIIAEKPPEVLFGLDINASGDVYFSISNKLWFDKIFAFANAITADIVEKGRYECGKPLLKDGFLRGYIMPSLYAANFKANTVPTPDGSVMIKLGTLPTSMLNKQLEGNLIIAHNRVLCFYSNFVNIGRSVWQLLPMSLYADTLVPIEKSVSPLLPKVLRYERKIEIVIPFDKNKTVYKYNDIKPLYDSLDLKKYDIKRLQVLAYSSVEGSLAVNETLMHTRGQAIINALKQFEPSLEDTTISTAENWLEFMRDIKNTPYEYLAKLGKEEIKKQLLNKKLASQIESIISKHRKAVVTIYLSIKSAVSGITNGAIIDSFTNAVAQKNMRYARIIQKEIIERIADNKMPSLYLNQLEVPLEKEYAEVINDREIYKYQLQLTTEYEALQKFLPLGKADPYNGKVLYNISALTLWQWQTGDDSINTKALLRDIYQLRHLNIDTSLVTRMLINYYVLQCDNYMRKLNYAAKDSSLHYIKQHYQALPLTDADRYALARYFSFYSREDWALEVITPRIDAIDVSEDLVFYYINLLFYHPALYSTDNFKKAVLNAINLDAARFCHFFDPIDSGGASMQLLEYEELRKLYCESCSN